MSYSLATALTILTNQTEHDQRLGTTVAPSQLIIVASQGTAITQADFESARRMINGSFRRFPDLYYIFVTNHGRTFEDLMVATNAITNGRNDRQYRTIVSNSVQIEVLERQLNEALETIPKRIIAPLCPLSFAERKKTWDDTLIK